MIANDRKRTPTRPLLGVMLALLTLLPGHGLQAALPPGAADELKALAPEVLLVEITGVEAGRPERGRFPVLYQARVLEVLRSGEGMAPGDTLAIDTFAVKGDSALVGPKPPPLLSPGWRGRVWLKPVPPTPDDRGERRFLPAAYGHGFEPLNGQQ